MLHAQRRRTCPAGRTETEEGEEGRKEVMKEAERSTTLRIPSLSKTRVAESLVDCNCDCGYGCTMIRSGAEDAAEEQQRVTASFGTPKEPQQMTR